MSIYSLNEISPSLPNGDFWISLSAQLVGDVRIGTNVSVWFGAVLRGDNEPIIINEDTNIQENTVIHVDKGSMVKIGRGCTIGHSVIVHGCTIGDNSLIGMGSTLLNDSKVGNNSIVGANSLITEGKVFPDNSLIIGSPAKVKRLLTDDEIKQNKLSALHYISNFIYFKKNLRKLIERDE